MNHKLKCYLRLRLNIPNYILLLIEQHLWKLNFAPNNLKLNHILYLRTNQKYYSSLFYLQENFFRKRRPQSKHNISLPWLWWYKGFWITTQPTKTHHYGTRCSYNQFLGTIQQRHITMVQSALITVKVVYITFSIHNYKRTEIVEKN